MEKKSSSKLTSLWEKDKFLQGSDYYINQISPDIIIDCNPLIGIRANQKCQRYPNITVYAIQPNPDFRSFIDKTYKDNKNLMIFGDERDVDISQILDIHLTDEFTESNPMEILFDFSGVASFIKNIEGINTFISMFSQKITEECSDYDIEDFESDRIRIFISFSDYFIPSDIREKGDVPMHVVNELIRTEDYKRYIEMIGGERAMRNVENLMNYMLLTRRKETLSRLYPADKPNKIFNRFSLSSEDLSKFNQLGTVVYEEVFMPKNMVKSFQDKNIEVNFNMYFNKLIKY